MVLPSRDVKQTDKYIQDSDEHMLGKGNKERLMPVKGETASWVVII